MSTRRTMVALAFALAQPAAARAQTDASFAGSDVRVFQIRAWGGRIELRRSPDDSAAVRAVRMRLREMVAAFSTGDFSSPAYARLRVVPGASIMIARRALIHFAYRDLPGGAEVVMTTNDVRARTAIEEFLTYQRGAPGSDDIDP